MKKKKDFRRVSISSPIARILCVCCTTYYLIWFLMVRDLMKRLRYFCYVCFKGTHLLSQHSIWNCMNRFNKNEHMPWRSTHMKSQRMNIIIQRDWNYGMHFICLFKDRNWNTGGKVDWLKVCLSVCVCVIEWVCVCLCVCAPCTVQATAIPTIHFILMFMFDENHVLRCGVVVILVYCLAVLQTISSFLLASSVGFPLIQRICNAYNANILQFLQSFLLFFFALHSTSFSFVCFWPDDGQTNGMFMQ